MKLGGVNTFAQGMKLEEKRRSLGVTGTVSGVTGHVSDPRCGQQAGYDRTLD
jgi:hypothetical protein